MLNEYIANVHYIRNMFHVNQLLTEEEKAEMLICLVLVSTVGGRSSEYSFQKLEEEDWSDLNSWDKTLNEALFYNMNHRLMIKRLLDTIE